MIISSGSKTEHLIIGVYLQAFEVSHAFLEDPFGAAHLGAPQPGFNGKIGLYNFVPLIIMKLIPKQAGNSRSLPNTPWHCDNLCLESPHKPKRAALLFFRIGHSPPGSFAKAQNTWVCLKIRIELQGIQPAFAPADFSAAASSHDALE